MEIPLSIHGFRQQKNHPLRMLSVKGEVFDTRRETEEFLRTCLIRDSWSLCCVSKVYIKSTEYGGV